MYDAALDTTVSTFADADVDVMVAPPFTIARPPACNATPTRSPHRIADVKMQRCTHRHRGATSGHDETGSGDGHATSVDSETTRGDGGTAGRHHQPALLHRRPATAQHLHNARENRARGGNRAT